MRRLIWLTTLLFVGCYDSGFESPKGDSNGEAKSMNISQLHTLFAGQTFRIESDVVIGGRVTTSDQEKNFYKSIFIEQDGDAVEIMVGIDHLHNDYPIGSQLTIRLQGLSVGESFGVLQVGRYPTAGSWFATDYIGSTKAAADRHIERCVDKPMTIVPKNLRIEELKPRMCGTLVKIEGLKYTPEQISEGGWTGYKRFTQQNGAQIYTYVREYADFAIKPPPITQISLVGILQYDTKNNGRYIIKLRNENDCVQ